MNVNESKNKSMARVDSMRMLYRMLLCTGWMVSCLDAFLLPSRPSVLLHQHERREQHKSVFLQGAFVRQKQHGGTLSMSTSSSNESRRGVIQRDVVVIGGGLAGLSAALALATHPTQPRHVTVLEQRPLHTTKDNSGSYAAAGMLAPQSERLPQGPLLDLCLQSRDMYPQFVRQVEELAKESGEDGWRYLDPLAVYHYQQQQQHSGNARNSGSDMAPWEVGYCASGGFIAPAFAGDVVADWSPPQGAGSARWLDEVQIRELEPQLHPNVIGGWWFPEDASVDARRLTSSLRAACVAAGVQMYFGQETAASALQLEDGICTGIHLNNGKTFTSHAILLANGAWMRNLLPIPITPHKGQSLSLRMPPHTPPLLSRVLFSQDTYIVPKADGRIVIGATVEPGSFDAHVTPAGIMHCLSNALRLIPALKDLPLEEVWSGLRPTTPDKEPILGRTQWKNLYVAGGYWRNGVLLAPKTGQLLADLVNLESGNDGKNGSGDRNGGSAGLEEGDEALLEAFSWERFLHPGGGKKLAVDARYAASIYPTQQRSQGFGTSAAVGTELGFYSDASSATEERKQDRDLSEDAMERAARMGKEDGAAFTMSKKRTVVSSLHELELLNQEEEEKKEGGGGVGGSASGEEDVQHVEAAKGSEGLVLTQPALDVEPLPTSSTPQTQDPLTTNENNKSKDEILSEKAAAQMRDIYEQIRQNKAQHNPQIKMGEETPEERPDFPFRIYHVDPVTREKREVPPYTSPEKFQSLLAAEKASGGVAMTTTVSAGVGVGVEKNGIESPPVPMQSPETVQVKEPLASAKEDETTYDGYIAIQEANGAATREQELEAMKAARRANRADSSGIDESKIGVRTDEDDEED